MALNLIDPRMVGPIQYLSDLPAGAMALLVLADGQFGAIDVGLLPGTGGGASAYLDLGEVAGDGPPGTSFQGGEIGGDAVAGSTYDGGEII